MNDPKTRLRQAHCPVCAKDGEKFAVCAACGSRSCFEGDLVCDDYKSAGITWVALEENHG